MLDKRASYTSADSLPLKLLMLEDPGRLRPVHVQWMPTNRCNLSCKFCSCSERDKSLEMPIDPAISVIRKFSEMGCEAVTITGGGEPLCHPHLPEMVDEFCRHGVKVGLVTNGLLLPRVPVETLRKLTWCRISHGDDRRFTLQYRESLRTVVGSASSVDWAFSYVIGGQPDYASIREIVEFANEHGFTHVRLVGDLMHPEDAPFDRVRQSIQGVDRIVIYQPRKEFTRGKDCLIGYVKPLVSPDFWMYMCCGVQYALEPMSKDLPDELCMGSALDLESVYRDVSPRRVWCSRCYYQQYNDLLKVLSSPTSVAHREFV
jgi:hypothetical protein